MAWKAKWENYPGGVVLTADEIKTLFHNYDQKIMADGCGGPIAQDRSALLDFDGPNRSLYFLEHARWMCKMMQKCDELPKLNRWLGFVQCVLIAQKLHTLDELREHVRQYE